MRNILNGVTYAKQNSHPNLLATTQPVSLNDQSKASVEHGGCRPKPKPRCLTILCCKQNAGLYLGMRVMQRLFCADPTLSGGLHDAPNPSPAIIEMDMCALPGSGPADGELASQMALLEEYLTSGGGLRVGERLPNWFAAGGLRGGLKVGCVFLRSHKKCAPACTQARITRFGCEVYVAPATQRACAMHAISRAGQCSAVACSAYRTVCPLPILLHPSIPPSSCLVCACIHAGVDGSAHIAAQGRAGGGGSGALRLSPHCGE